MRTSLLLFLLAGSIAQALETPYTDEQRTERSAAVFTGRVVTTNFISELRSGALWRAEVKVESVEKPEATVKTNAVFYYEQAYSVHDERGTRWHGSVCPGYPNVVIGQRAKFWCTRWTVAGHRNILFVPSPSWITTVKKRAT
jgi:hypothetical protein